MREPSDRRDDLFQQAKDYARNQQWDRMTNVIAEANKVKPLTHMQAYRLRNLIGEYKFDELNLSRFFQE